MASSAKKKIPKRKPTRRAPIKNNNTSHFWKSLMRVRDQFLNLGHFNLASGNHTRFWEDAWLNNHTLKDTYPNLYNIARKKHVSVANVFSSVPLNVSFRRSLDQNKLRDWHKLIASIAHINFTTVNRVIAIFGGFSLIFGGQRLPQKKCRK